jgi:hypothetical protein
MHADNYAPPTSISPGTDAPGVVLREGSSDGVADAIRARHLAPGESQILVLECRAGAIPDAALHAGRLARVSGGSGRVLAVSDGEAWRALIVGSVIG